MQKADDINNSEAYSEVLSPASNAELSQNLGNRPPQKTQDEIPIPGTNFDPMSQTEMDIFDWGFGIQDDE